jgi:hypothetical protein
MAMRVALERGTPHYSIEGLPCTPLGVRMRPMQHDPATHMFIMATAAITSIAFMVSVLNVLAVILSHLMN